MTDEKDQAALSLEDLFGESEESSKFELEVMRERTAVLGAKFVPIAMKLKTQQETAKEEMLDKSEMVTKSVSVTMPSAAWEGLQTMADLFEIFEEYKDNSQVPLEIIKIVQRNKELYGTDASAVLISQAALDNLTQFISTMAQTALLTQAEKLKDSPEELEKFLNRLEKEMPPEKK